MTKVTAPAPDIAVANCVEDDTIPDGTSSISLYLDAVTKPKSVICWDLDTIPCILDDKNPRLSIWTELLINSLPSIVVNLLSKEDKLWVVKEAVVCKFEIQVFVEPV